jgi:ribosomal protein S18 acetylase RimI-like enzyme
MIHFTLHEIVYAMNRRTMRAYVEPIWGWDEAEQRAMFDRRFTLDGHFFILVDEQIAGRVVLLHPPECDFISQINILPDYQGRGIGTAVIEAIQKDAAARHKPVELRVLVTNSNARRLYERLGFRIFEQTDTHFWMRWMEGQS